MAVSAGAGSAHFGGALSIVEIVSTLFAYQMKIDKKNPKWEERDRFILSKRHACLVYYAALCEVGIYNIRVNTIAPGLTDTDMMRKNTPKDIVDEVISRISLKRIANPEEIAKVALLLSSDLSSYITGQVIRVDGGI